MLRNRLIFAILAFSLVLTAPALALTNISVVDNSGAITLLIGNLTQTYSLQVNLSSTTAEGAATPNITFTMPYGIVNATQCGNFTTLNATNVRCFISFGNLASGSVLRANLTIRTSISAYTTYGPQVFTFTAACANCSLSSTTTKSVTGTPFTKNPRPDAVNTTTTNATLRFLTWNQTDSKYQVMTPIFFYNVTSGRPQVANNSFGDVLFFDKSFFEFPEFMRLFTYNLTFRLIFQNEENITFIVRSPINTSLYSDQVLVPIFVRTEQQFDPFSNITRNLTLGVPSQSGNFTIYRNGVNFTDTSLLSQGINITYNFGAGPPGTPDQSTQLLSVSVTNVTAANNSDISILFTLMNSTACINNLSCTVSPIFVKSQQLSGWTAQNPPDFGQTIDVSYLINVTNVLLNYTLDNLRISIMQPMNVTVTNATNSSQVFGQFNMTTNPVMSVWNGTEFVENLGVIITDSNVTFTERFGDAPENITLFIRTFDVFLPNSTPAVFNGWTPGTNPYAYINFTATMTFPVMEEFNSTPGTQGSTNEYNASINVPQRAPLDVSGKLPGLDTATCGSTGSTCSLNVTVDGVQLSTANFTLGSLILNDVSSGTHTVSVSYQIPAAAAETPITSSGGGGGAAYAGPPRDVHILTQITPGAATIYKITNSELGFKQISLTVNNPANEIRITITKLAGQPASVTKTISGVAYQYLEVNTTNLPDTNIRSVMIRFNVTKAWLTNNSFDKNEITLRRFANNDWKTLPTNAIGESATQVEYEALSQGFSTFAITGEQIAEAPAPPAPQPEQQPAPAPQPEPTQPGPVTVPAAPSADLLYYFAAIIIVLAGGYWYYTTNKLKKK